MPNGKELEHSETDVLQSLSTPGWLIEQIEVIRMSVSLCLRNVRTLS
jgi:hypothetical protein